MSWPFIFWTGWVIATVAIALYEIDTVPDGDHFKNWGLSALTALLWPALVAIFLVGFIRERT